MVERAKVGFQDTKHLWLVGLAIAIGGVVAVFARNSMVPTTYGDQGPYRSAALEVIAARPSFWQSDATCHECHQNVAKERAECAHKAVRCAHCHGVGKDHVWQARQAANSPGVSIAPAGKWDGKRMSEVDLYTTKDRAICLSCHEAAIGMPEGFRKIKAAEHLESMGAKDADSSETCFECHKGHNTAP